MSWENLSRDLHTILNSYLDLVGCDGGSIYTLEKNLQGGDVLVFKAMITRSLGISGVPTELKSAVFRLDEHSLVGRTGLERKVFNESYRDQPKNSTDQALNFQTRNILSAPLLTPRGDLVGVVQLVNKLPVESETKADFDVRDERLCAIVSAQAALAIENSTLLVEQERIFDGFVNACVTAIEARDPVTSGHSQRVCDLSLNLAESVNREKSGTLAHLHFTDLQMREIRYAAMLHDMGKISVREDLLQKEKKLFPWELNQIEMRFKTMKIALKLEHAKAHGEDHRDQLELARRLKELVHAWTTIQAANEPSVLPTEVSAEILELTKLQVVIDDGEVCCALHAHEKDKLCIPKGSLSHDERKEIEKHVSFTYEILKMVPWGRGLENVPLIAHRHHEKLDGSGYPSRVTAVDIPVQSRILTITDIYDALTAKDRPYKPAVPLEKALAILEDDVKHGKLDPVLLKIFIDSRAYRLPEQDLTKPSRRIA
jgi:HD-GYP domain-containing protein (c-di-GMP phosphodiesterase class II)